MLDYTILYDIILHYMLLQCIILYIHTHILATCDRSAAGADRGVTGDCVGLQALGLHPLHDADRAPPLQRVQFKQYISICVYIERDITYHIISYHIISYHIISYI